MAIEKWAIALEAERDGLLEERVKQENYIQKLNRLFLELAEHTDYCGYGDSYERSGAKESGLIGRVNEMVESIKRNP